MEIVHKRIRTSRQTNLLKPGGRHYGVRFTGVFILRAIRRRVNTVVFGFHRHLHYSMRSVGNWHCSKLLMGTFTVRSAEKLTLKHEEYKEN